MKIFLKNLILFVGVFAFGSFWAQGETKLLEKANYSIIYPSAWVLEKADSTMSFSITAPNDAVDDRFVENLNLTLIPMKTKMTESQYAQFAKSYLPSKIQKFKVTEEKATSINGKKAYYLVFTGIKDGKKLKWKQYYLMHKEHCYCLTATIEECKFTAYRDPIHLMIKSFKLK